MAPKKRSSSVRRPAVSPSAEIRAKRSRDSSLSSPSASSSRGRLFVATRTVPTGRCLSLSFFDQEQFRIGTWIRQQGWEKLCSLEVNVYPNLVREFFENISFENPVKVKSVVKGVHISLSESFLGQLLMVPRIGLSNLNLFDKAEALKMILEREEVNVNSQLYSQQLSVEMRVLLCIVSHIIFPKVGRHDWVGVRELGVMFFLVSGTPISFPSLFLQQLKDTASKSKACLPYGMIFTLIFKEFQVSLEGEDFKKLVSADYINEGTLNRMKFVKKDDKWIRADLSTVQDSDIPRTAPPPPSPPTAEPSPSIPEPPLPQSPIPPPQPAFDQDILVERIVDKVVEKVSEKFMSVISELRHQILISSEEQKISSEGQSDMISQQISSLSQRMEFLEKDQQKVLAQMESLATENARIKQRLEENITVQCTTAQILIKTVQQILDRTPSSGPSSSSAPSSRPFSSPAPHLFSTGPPPPKGPKIEFLSDEESD